MVDLADTKKMRLSALMCVYNEAEYVDFAIRSCLDYIDDLIIVEGAYKETIALGKSPRSDDGTLDILSKYLTHPKVRFLQANEESDAQQRNVGLEEIKKVNKDGWLIIIDGDEVYDPSMFKIIRSQLNALDSENSTAYASYFSSITFVNDFWHYTNQEFPRLFKITEKCSFYNDNYMAWPDIGKQVGYTKIPFIKYYHYAFAKSLERFATKKKWWETRFKDKKFDYGWHANKDGVLEDPSHRVFEFTGKHPKIMEEHKYYNKGKK